MTVPYLICGDFNNLPSSVSYAFSTFRVAAVNMAKRPARADSPHISRRSSASHYYERFIAKQLEKTSSRKRTSSPNISAQSNSEKNTAKAGRRKARRPRPPPEVFNYLNVVCYFDEDTALIAQETVHQTSGGFDVKRRKRNIKPEDDLVALFYLLDPVSLKEVAVRTST